MNNETEHSEESGNAVNSKLEPSESKKKEMYFFKSFEEEQEAHYKWLASLSEVEHLANAVKNIKRIYAKELRENPELGTNFIVDK